jgi:hypothetical protein
MRLAWRPTRSSIRCAATGPAGLCISRKYCVLDIFRFLIIGAASLLLARPSAVCAQSAVRSHAQADPRTKEATSSAREKAVAGTGLFAPWFIILKNPDDLAAFWQSIERPDLMVIKADQLPLQVGRDGLAEGRVRSARSVVESVRLRGQITEDFGNLKVDLSIVVKGAESIWVPIGLGQQSLLGAREQSLELSLQRVEPAEWQVKLEGDGEHHIEVELRAPLSVVPARKSLSLAIPEAASTSVELVFSHGESDVVVGANEVLVQPDPAGGKETHLTVHLSPRSRLDLSWTPDAGTGARNPPLLTAKSEIAIDIDDEQMRARTSWAIRSIRGTTRSLEMQVDADDEVTELQIDDQSAEAGIERVLGSGKLVIRLPDPLRTGVVKRLVMKTRRSFAKTGSRRISFAGYPLVGAREQSGYIGITQSANLFVNAPTSQGLRAVDTDKLPENLRTRPSTSLAFEFLDQPFMLELVVEPSPPLVKADLKTLFRIGSDRVRSETTIDLDWVRGQLSELELGVAPGLQVISVGPPEIVESSHLSDENQAPGPAGPNAPARRLTIRLTPLGRDPDRVSVVLTGQQQFVGEGKVKLGLFTPVQAASVTALYALVADRGLALTLDDETGRIRISSESSMEKIGPKAGWPWRSLRGEQIPRPLLLADDGLSPFLPITIARHSRTIGQETLLSAQVSRRWVDLVERATFTVRFGSVSSLDICVPASIADRWELLDKELVDREDLGREPDGACKYRLTFARPVVDKATVRVRYRLPLVPGLDARSEREITIPRITVKDVVQGPAKVELSLAPEIVLKETDKAWLRSSDDGRGEPQSESALISFEEQDGGPAGRSFVFKALALEGVSLPSFVVPRLLLKTVSVGDDTITTSARYWVESHGLDFPFALPDGARWIGARVDGRLAEHVDYDPSQGSYRLRLPADVGSRPVLIELEYQSSAQVVRSKWAAPRLLDGGAVLQTLWEVRVPKSSVLLGLPRGWSDENQWYWSGYMWKRRPWQNLAGMNDWLLGAGAPARGGDDIDRLNLDHSDRYVFSRSGRPVVLGVWVVPRSWLVAICSGVTLLVGFLAIFSRVRFRTAWLVIAVIGLLAAVLVQPSVTVILLESAVIGAILILSGLLIESHIVRSRSRSISVLGGALSATRPATDSSLVRSPGVGSDDSTAIRVRVPSTMDFVAAPLAVPGPVGEPGGSSWEQRS